MAKPTTVTENLYSRRKGRENVNHIDILFLDISSLKCTKIKDE